MAEILFVATYKLSIELVPEPLFKVNLRHRLPAAEWQKLRAAVLERKGRKCSICDGDYRIAVHEQWEYDRRSKTARLRALQPLCWWCHAVEHFGNTQVQFPQAVPEVVAHFCRVNDATPQQFKRHMTAARRKWEERSELTWEINWGGMLGERRRLCFIESRPCRYAPLDCLEGCRLIGAP